MSIGQILTRAYCAARVNWCLNHLQFTHVDWNSVLSTDESRFNLSHADGWVMVQHMLGESNTDA